MIAMAFKFNAGRYHATQWGRHVNEGVLEWPPSPWRILRCLVAVWRRTLPDMPAEAVVPVLERLAEEPPVFRLPPATAAHTRHYMPTNANPTMVIDSFAVIEPADDLVAIWPNVEFSPEQRSTLSAVLNNLWYLGRAESWCEARLVESPPEPNCKPLELPIISSDEETVRVLVPKSPMRMKDLYVETGENRRQGRIDPPGASWMIYTRPADCFSQSYSPVSDNDNSTTNSNVVRFALACNVLPLVTDTVRVAELARQSAMSRYKDRNEGGASQILSGMSVSGPLKGHRHAFYLPTDEDGDGRLDHLTVWAPCGFNANELNALGSVLEMRQRDGRESIKLLFEGFGGEHEFSGAVPIFSKSTKWRTVTPFVLNRHMKWRGPRGEKRMVDGPEDQVRKEIERRESITASVLSVEKEDPGQPRDRVHGHEFRPLEFYRWRRSGSNGGGAYNFTVTFAEPVVGPIALGYACHFGLGLFVPD